VRHYFYPKRLIFFFGVLFIENTVFGIAKTDTAKNIFAVSANSRVIHMVAGPDIFATERIVQIVSNANAFAAMFETATEMGNVIAHEIASRKSLQVVAVFTIFEIL